jgi:photosystem II stability/assembly factor-like uncharacterized protein
MLLLPIVSANGQWKRTGQPECDWIVAMTICGTDIFASTYDHGIYRSTDVGDSWVPASEGIGGNFITCLFTDVQTIYAGGWYEVFVSTNYGGSWSEITGDIHRYLVLGLPPDIHGFAKKDSLVFAVSKNALAFRTSNMGATWKHIDSGTTNRGAVAITASRRSVIIAGGSKVYRSTNNGDFWINSSAGIPSTSSIKVLSVKDSIIFAGTYDHGVYKSLDDGVSWYPCNVGLGNLLNLWINCFAMSGNTIYIATGFGGVYRSTNDGASWGAINNGMSPGTNAVIASDSYVFVGTDVGVYRSTNEGATWSPINHGLNLVQPVDFASSGDNLYIGTRRGVFGSTNRGLSWLPVAPGKLKDEVTSVTVDDTILYVSSINQVNRSTDFGATWKTSGQVFPSRIRSFGANHENIFVGVESNGIFYSSDRGETWSERNNGLLSRYIYSYAFKEPYVFAGSWLEGVFRSSNNGGNWQQVSNGLTDMYVNAMVVCKDDLYAGTLIGGVYRTTDNGSLWTQVNNGLTNTAVTSMIAYDKHIFTGTQNGLYSSGNRGEHWIDISEGITDKNIFKLAIAETNLFVLTATNTVYYRPLSELITGVEHREISTTPQTYSLEQNFPNPFNPKTIMRFTIPEKARVTLRVMDLRGKVIKVLVNEVLPVGSHQITFDATGLASGVYFYRLQAVPDGKSGAKIYMSTKKCVLIK